ncbi:hypothetical protein WJ96_04530 [Burkholderia ubonensis]|uniref:Uncharacterized protein n=1 Tax=Burkholderia ubonensis TaxID=101571 RepID=A0AAW3MYF7_9BURK|nr:hypothetical protein [Burkholderia ubonensis]KVP65639.1 hypothetical protein WJ93_24265 [Burkholderia ubonensis]KVP97842.1 hypothetical protein WJ96_04530 [Burkholderia ubonensis]KVZ92539.1 hypothetical protein WL25_16185 [Burkholderia ubonensis]
MTTQHKLVSDVIRRCLADWRGHKTYAWAGECGIFADWVYHEAKSCGLTVELDSFNDALDCTSPLAPPPGVTFETLESLGVLRALNHVWIVVDGRHYDAASPDGEATPCDLRCVRQALVEMLRQSRPQLLGELSATHSWWQESEALTDEFLGLETEREAQYEEN